jgi:hypothetical protein
VATLSDLQIVGVLLLGVLLAVVVNLLDWPNNRVARHHVSKSLKAAGRIFRKTFYDSK